MSAIREFRRDSVAGFLHEPAEPIFRDALVLTHGAGSNCQSPLLLAVANAFATCGLTVLRVNLPFRQRRPFGPPSPTHSATDRAGLEAAVVALSETVPGRIFLGGHSYGGRQATMLATENPGVAAALLLLSYPLHPPDKPDQQRIGHFPSLHTPSLFVHGTRDPFGTIEEMNQALTCISGAHALVVLENAGHDLAGGKFDAALIVEPFQALLAKA